MIQPPEIEPKPRPEGQTSPEYTRPQGIEEFNQLDLPPAEKVDLLLVYLGEKPATEWHYDAVSRQPGWPEIDHGRDRFDRVAAWATKTGLATEVEERTVNPIEEQLKGIEGQWLREELAAKGTLAQAESDATNPELSTQRLSLLLAQDQVWLEKIRAAVHERDPQLYGESVGFPNSAVEAFMAHRHISPQTLADVAPEVLAFAMYGVSPEHAHEELATAQRWSEAVRQADPELYAQMLANLKS